MLPDRIDPASALKKLFERRRSSPASSPEALFRAASAENPASPAGADGTASSPVSKRSLPIKEMAQKVGKGLRSLAKWIPARSSSSQGVIGLDIGTSAIKGVRVEAGEKRRRLTSAFIEELPVGPGEELAREALVVDRLRDLKRKGLLNAPIVLNFHHLDSVIEVLHLPKMPASELEQAVLWEAKEKLSLKPERSVIRYLVTGTTRAEGQDQLDILLVSAPKEQILADWRMLAELGLKVAAMEPTSLAPFYPLGALNLWKPTDVVGLLEIGLKTSHFNLIHGGAVRFSRSFPVAGDSITQAIADYCQIEYARAEEFKLRFGISKMALEEDRQETGHATEDRVKVSHALGLHLEQLVAEMEHSFRYFAIELGETDAPRMEHLFLTGGGGLLKYLPEFLNSRLSLPVELADPTRGFEMEPAVEEQMGPARAHRLAVSIGLGLRAVS